MQQAATVAGETEGEGEAATVAGEGEGEGKATN